MNFQNLFHLVEIVVDVTASKNILLRQPMIGKEFSSHGAAGATNDVSLPPSQNPDWKVDVTYNGKDPLNIAVTKATQQQQQQPIPFKHQRNEN